MLSGGEQHNREVQMLSGGEQHNREIEECYREVNSTTER
jgi:hypothetical protein